MCLLCKFFTNASQSHVIFLWYKKGPPTIWSLSPAISTQETPAGLLKRQASSQFAQLKIAKQARRFCDGLHYREKSQRRFLDPSRTAQALSRTACLTLTSRHIETSILRIPRSQIVDFGFNRSQNLARKMSASRVIAHWNARSVCRLYYRESHLRRLPMGEVWSMYSAQTPTNCTLDRQTTSLVSFVKMVATHTRHFGATMLPLANVCNRTAIQSIPDMTRLQFSYRQTKWNGIAKICGWICPMLIIKGRKQQISMHKSL